MKTYKEWISSEKTLKYGLYTKNVLKHPCIAVRDRKVVFYRKINSKMDFPSLRIYMAQILILKKLKLYRSIKNRWNLHIHEKIFCAVSPNLKK